jgi:hypothetical protein
MNSSILASVVFILIATSFLPQSIASEISPKQTIATDGYCQQATHPLQEGPAFGDDKLYLAYMDNSGSNVCHNSGSAGSHKIYVKKLDYQKRQWTTSPPLSSVEPSCCDGHETPIVYRDAKGYLDVFYAPITAARPNGNSCPSRSHGPFYRRSLNPDDITAWGAEMRVPMCGAFSENSGGYTANGFLHLFGQQQWGTAANPSYDLIYIKRAPDLVWSNGVSLIRDNGKDDAVGGGRVGPGCMHDQKIVGNTIHLIWSSTTNGCSGSGENLYYAQSQDNGETWRSIDGSANFTRATGLTATSALTYPTKYLVKTGSTTNDLKVDALKDGTVIIAHRVGGAIELYKWTGSSWEKNIIEASGMTSPFGLTLGVTATDKIVVVSGNGSNVFFYESTNKGSTWEKVQIHTKGPEANNRNFLSTIARPKGFSERLFLQWVQTFNVTSQRPEFHTEIVFLEIAFPETGISSQVSPPNNLRFGVR